MREAVDPEADVDEPRTRCAHETASDPGAAFWSTHWTAARMQAEDRRAPGYSSGREFLKKHWPTLGKEEMISFGQGGEEVEHPLSQVTRRLASGCREGVECDKGPCISTEHSSHVRPSISPKSSSRRRGSAVAPSNAMSAVSVARTRSEVHTPVNPIDRRNRRRRAWSLPASLSGVSVNQRDQHRPA